MQQTPPHSPTLQSANPHDVLPLAQLFSTCVECFGLIHPSKNSDRPQELLLCKLGIEQARLLAWGDNVGITESQAANRNPSLDNPEVRTKVEAALHNIIERPAHVHRVTQFEKYGLKPPKRFTVSYQPALDSARLEVFREKFEALNNERWEVRRGMSVTAHHWMLSEIDKFPVFIDLVRHNVNELINLFGNTTAIDRAVKSDIKALGWHPVFDTWRASTDSTKLRLIKDACAESYPDYAAETAVALSSIERESADAYEERRNKDGRKDSIGYEDHDNGSEIPGVAAKMAQQAAEAKTSRPAHEKRPSFFDIFKRKSHKKVPTSDATSRPAAARSQSYAQPSGKHLTPPDSPEPERSKSIGHIGMTHGIDSVGEATGDGQGRSSMEANALSQTETYKSAASANIIPITSMISRHDQWRPDA